MKGLLGRLEHNSLTLIQCFEENAKKLWEFIGESKNKLIKAFY